MLRRILGTTLVFVGVAAPRPLTAQTTITLEMPVNFTQLSPNIEKIIFSCTITSTAIAANPSQSLSAGGPVAAEDGLPVVGGKLVTTMRVVFVFPEGSLQSPIGKTANYSCVLAVHTKTGGASLFSETSTDPTFYLKPAPPELKGSFVW